jgi:hypothetical protein
MSKQAQNKRPAVVVFGAVALALAGCSGSSEDARDQIVVRPSPSFAATNALSQQLFAEAVTASPTITAQLPVTGTATYRGAATYVDSNTTSIPKDLKFPEYETFIVNNPDYVSQVLLVANFQGDSVTGTMGGFRTPDNRFQRIGITFTGSIVNSSSDTAGFVGTLSGSREITGADGKIEAKSFTGPVEGNFVGPRGETVLGTLAITKGFTGEELGDVFGVFTAVQ